MSNDISNEHLIDEFTEHEIRQIIERAKMATTGLGLLLLGYVNMMQLPESQQFLSEEAKEMMRDINIEDLKEKAKKLLEASETLGNMQNSEMLEYFKIAKERQDVFVAYTTIALGLKNLRNFLEGKSSL